ncbi:hypothetical protein RSOLAG1IB_01528 [Rhizoctonia solani AG-1 IB]|uniref:Cytochrome c oxidase assembly factor 5 n=1 Tax=Thanatephorus cucumeris (strain AG1-IB / isolate 7/3/14) TaxID=1108050 RepID=A0A0B7FBV0_THACB|nr:hypothetical protein RSOLAG1IB_01528 [Rhizoctonia solani AG-1 IB]
MSTNSCQYLLDSLKACLLQSDCVRVQGIAPSKCLRDHAEELPEECRHLRKALFECKRGKLDMRKRFRGNAGGRPANLKSTDTQDDEDT